MDLVFDCDDIGLPENLLYYAKRNAKPRLLLKLMKASRYFCFPEFPYLVVKNLTNINHKWQYLPLGQNDKNGNLFYDNYKDIDLDYVEMPSITNRLEICRDSVLSPNQHIASKLISKLGVFELKELSLDSQILTMDEFELLVSSRTVEKFVFEESQVKYPDGSIVPVDECVRLMPKLIFFQWFHADILRVTDQTAANLIAYINPSILTYFDLTGISDAFDFHLFIQFMNMHPEINLSLSFNSSTPPISEDYSNMLKAYADNLVKSGEYKTRKIMIICPEQDEDEYDMMMEEFHNNLQF